jgi:hypothetical protein
MYASTNKMAARYRELLQGLEQRSHERVNLALECRVTSGSKRSAGSMKVVENISRTGILIRWLPSDGPQDFHDRRYAQHRDALPVNHNFDRKCWFCGGTVVRVSKSEDNAPLVAVRVNTTKFRKYTGATTHKPAGQIPQLVTATH